MSNNANNKKKFKNKPTNKSKVIYFPEANELIPPDLTSEEIQERTHTKCGLVSAIIFAIIFVSICFSPVLFILYSIIFSNDKVDILSIILIIGWTPIGIVFSSVVLEPFDYWLDVHNRDICIIQTKISPHYYQHRNTRTRTLTKNTYSTEEEEYKFTITVDEELDKLIAENHITHLQYWGLKRSGYIIEMIDMW